MQRRVTWDLADWPRVRDLQESLAWIRARLVVPEPVELSDETGAKFGVILAQEPVLLLPR